MGNHITSDEGNHQDANVERSIKDEEMSALLYVTETILKTQDFNHTAKLVFDSCASLIGAKAGYVALLSDDGHENELLFLEDGGMACTVDPELPMPIRGLREEAYLTGKVVYDNDFMKSDWVKFMPAGHMDLKNVLFSPLNIDNKTVGIMGFACKDGDFNENDAKVAAVFGNYAAIALQNSRNMEALISANRAKERLLSIIAHDLKSPFNALLGYSNLLMEEVLESTNQNLLTYTKQINKTLKRSYDFLTNLLEWSRLQTSKIEIHRIQIEIHGLIAEVIEILQLQAKNKQIRIESSIKKDALIFADKNMLKVVLMNLFSNAIKFSNPGGVIHVWEEQVGSYHKIFVRDEGVGLDEATIDKLFKEDELYSTSGTNNESGTGIGLVLCREFIKRHGGDIGVESQVNEGATFWFSMPAD